MRKKKTEVTIRSSAAEYLTFVASTGDRAESYEMRYEDENIWLTQKMMAALYDVSKQSISQHIQRIYDDGELLPETTVKKYLTVQTEGIRQISRNLDHYSLQMIIAVGFKVNNQRAVQFRKWAGQIVKDHTIQGWTMDQERLKKGHMFTDELTALRPSRAHLRPTGWSGGVAPAVCGRLPQQGRPLKRAPCTPPKL